MCTHHTYIMNNCLCDESFILEDGFIIFKYVKMFLMNVSLSLSLSDWMILHFYGVSKKFIFANMN